MKKLHLLCCIFLIKYHFMYAEIFDEYKENIVYNDTDEHSLIDLEVSAKLIRIIISKNQLNTIIEEHDVEQLELFLNNFSPAQMAFEAEVLASNIPLIIVYYFKKSTEETLFIKQLIRLSKIYDNEIKFVIVEADALFSLAQDAQIDYYPTILFVKNRTIIDRIEQGISIDLIENKILQYKIIT